MPFISNTAAQRAAMLAEMGLTEADLFAAIPEELRAKPLLLGEGLSEQEVLSHMAAVAGRNTAGLTSFLGGGFYDHFVPSAVEAVTGRSEFYTAYTPYQPEISQGTLQAMYEYQSMICRLTEMEVANASLYDGGTALYEAITMSLRITGRNQVIVCQGVNPIHRKMIRSYTGNLGIELIEVPCVGSRGERVPRGEGVPPLRVADILSARAEGILPSIASSSSSSSSEKQKQEEETRGRDARDTRGQDVRDTRGQDALATPATAGKTDRQAIARLLSDKTAAIVVQNPNFFGCIDDATDLGELAHGKGALLVSACYPISLGLLKTPGAMGADIVTAEGQSLGLGLSFGGPYLGVMATRMKHVRKMPGRLAGRTVDSQGRDGFVLTLQAREQHIRREKATSNICTNQNLCALTALAYLSLLGKEGLRRTAQLCADKAYYAQKRLLAIDGVSLRFPHVWYFNEFVLELPGRADRVIRRLIEKDLAAGFPLDRYYEDMENSLLVAVTEKRTKEEIDYFVHALEVCL
jgi:glycine cleavage system pyridoxal-binding protein P